MFVHYRKRIEKTGTNGSYTWAADGTFGKIVHLVWWHEMIKSNLQLMDKRSHSGEKSPKRERLREKKCQ